MVSVSSNRPGKLGALLLVGVAFVFLFVFLTTTVFSLCIPGWPGTQRDPSASELLGLKVCATIPHLYLDLKINLVPGCGGARL